MSANKKEEFRKLVEKYLNGTATEEESRALMTYYSLFESAPEIAEMLTTDQLRVLGDRMKKKIATRIHPAVTPFYLRPYFRIAAMILILLGTGWLFSIHYLEQDGTETQVTQATAEEEEAIINRFLTLPDGSTVVLHKGSKLELSEDFNRSQRIVHLTGEAYFDVKHRAEVPFVIYTNKLKTTVLGTAFNIRAWPDQKDITVSVTRGKVQVEDENKLIAVLTPDRQVVYNTETSDADRQQQGEVKEAITWLEQDMTFDEMPFGQLANRLGKRYGVRITFSNPELGHCPITGRFSGTETLEEVLRTLTLTSNTEYSFTAGGIIIKGERCL